MTKTQLHALLAAGETRAVIEALLDQTPTVRELRDEAVALSNRFHRHLREKHGGTISVADSELELNRINAAALNLIGRLGASEGVTQNAPFTEPTELHVSCKTNKGTENLRFRAGEDMQLFVSVSQPCYLRVIYRLADGRLALLDDGRQITAAALHRFIQTGPDFSCDAPFGSETLYVFAQSAPFLPLNTAADPDGYTRITDELPTALQKTRGFKAKNRFAEAHLEILTAEE